MKRLDADESIQMKDMNGSDNKKTNNANEIKIIVENVDKNSSLNDANTTNNTNDENNSIYNLSSSIDEDCKYLKLDDICIIKDNDESMNEKIKNQ